MNYLSIDYLIVYAFLGITALVGLGGLRMSAASKSFREYAIANQSFGLGALIITFLATHMSGGWLFALPDRVYDHGLTWILQQVLVVAYHAWVGSA